MVRVRFAPSPTGFLHIGAARTCFFNWLYARSQNGIFILRIEDTDMARSSEEMTKGIIQGLRWLGLDWDEGPVFQSQRLPLYLQKAAELVEKGLAYHCYCTPEEISERAKKTEGTGDFWGYDRFCLHLSERERVRLESEGRPKAVRFLVPDGKIRYADRIHGDITVDSKNIEDFVLLRGDGLPTYHLSVVVDDIDSQISHVIRGDDHISNTPKQVIIYQALGFKLPHFSHIPMILSAGGGRLSKRTGATSIKEYRQMGFLAQAIVNYLSLLGWSPKDNREIISKKETINIFSLADVNNTAAIFNLDKLKWVNSSYIKDTSDDNLIKIALPFFEEKGYIQKDIKMQHFA